MKPNTLRTEIFLLPQPPHRFYSKADCAKDQSTYGIDLSDAIHAALNGLALAGKVDWEEVGSDLIDMAIDVLEGTTKHPPESQVTDTPSDDAANYWGTLQDRARNRVGELLLIADTYLLPYIPAIRKVGQVVAMEGFRAFLKHTYEVQMLMEPKPVVSNEPLPNGTDINTLPADAKYWAPCNQDDLEIAPACHDLAPQSLAKLEASISNVAAAYHASRDDVAMVSPDLPAAPIDPADTPLVFFTSRHAELIYKLTQLQGAQRCNELGITRAHYVDAALASRWYFDIASKLQGTGGGLSVRALREATRIYKTLIDPESLWGSSQSMVTAMETNGCLPTGEF